MSEVRYKSLNGEKKTCDKKVVVIYILVFLSLGLISFLFYRKLKADFEIDDSDKYYSINEGEIFSINKTMSPYFKNEIILKRPVILLPQVKPQVPLKVVCYYNFPSNKSDLQPESIEDLCSHINVAFASIDPFNFSIRLGSSQLQILTRLYMLKTKYKDLKILISVGGAGPSNFGVMVANHYHRKLILLKQYFLDGVDLDWEWPVVNGNPKEKVQFIQLLYEIRQEFNRHKKPYILSAAVAAVESLADEIYYIQHMAEYVDYVNIMGYDYHYYTSYYPVTDHNAPLYPSAKDGSYLLALNVNYSVNYWIQQGMPRYKIVLGMPMYGHSYRLVNGLNHGLHAPSSGFGTVGEGGFSSYPQTCEFMSHITTSKELDTQAKVPYIYDFYNWVSYDDEKSLVLKSKFIVEENLAGGMTYSLNSDDHQGVCLTDGITFPLHKAVRSTLVP